MSVRRLIISAAIASCVAAYGVAVANAQGGAGADAEKREGAAESSAEERQLVSASRAAVIAAGISPKFFDEHFRLQQVLNRPADRRVVWRLKVGEHEATLNDAVGSYTDEQGRRRYTHSLPGLLAPARDIGRTITLRRAERLMKACIGDYQGAAVVYQPFGSPPRAALVFTAMSAPPPAPKASTQTKPAATAAGAATAPKAGAPVESDTIRQGGKKPPPPRLGLLDLETGRCIVGVAQSGSPHPEAEKYVRPRR